MTKNQEIAVFWDYENVRLNAEGLKVPVAEKLVDYINTLGYVRIKRVYSNWGSSNPAINKALYSLGFEPIHVSMGKANSVDVKIAVDILDTAMIFPELHTYLIVTGDKDFIPVVNWLKNHGKYVIIIGKSDIVSEHLLLSADHFVSLEEFSKKNHIASKSKSNGKKLQKNHSISYANAVKCLVEVISNARDQNKSTRFNTIDNLMRSNQNFDYRGSTSIVNPDNKISFKTFSKFIAEVEKQGKIKSETIEGFKELFLIEENPKIESEFGTGPRSVTEREDWHKIIAIIEKKFQEILEKFDNSYATYVYLSMGIHKEKKNFNLLYSGSVLKKALTSLIEVGFLQLQENNHLVLADNFQDWKDWYIDQIIYLQKAKISPIS